MIERETGETKCACSPVNETAAATPKELEIHSDETRTILENHPSPRTTVEKKREENKSSQRKKNTKSSLVVLLLQLVASIGPLFPTVSTGSLSLSLSSQPSGVFDTLSRRFAGHQFTKCLRPGRNFHPSGEPGYRMDGSWCVRASIVVDKRERKSDESRRRQKASSIGTRQLEPAPPRFLSSHFERLGEFIELFGVARLLP